MWNEDVHTLSLYAAGTYEINERLHATLYGLRDFGNLGKRDIPTPYFWGFPGMKHSTVGAELDMRFSNGVSMQVGIHATRVDEEPWNRR